VRSRIAWLGSARHDTARLGGEWLCTVRCGLRMQAVAFYGTLSGAFAPNGQAWQGADWHGPAR
jgi:hypothetical protein